MPKSGSSRSALDRGERNKKEFGSNGASVPLPIDPTPIEPTLLRSRALSRLVVGESKNPSSSIHDTGDEMLDRQEDICGGDKMMGV